MTTKPETGKRVRPDMMPDDGCLHCLICYKKGADRHLFQEEETEVWYSGQSFHANCLDDARAIARATIREKEKEKAA